MNQIEVIGTENLKQHTKDNIVNLVLHTLQKDKQVLVFNNSKNSSEATAEKIAIANKKFLKNPIELKQLSDKILKVLSPPTKQCRRLAKCVEGGAAFHHSGLVSKQRQLIEDNFKSGLIKVISSTPTLAAGLNLPAYKVIIKDYKRYSSRGFNDIPVLEFLQMAGRAGRPGKETEGRAVLHVKSEDELSRVVPKYVFGKAEEIYSKLAVEPTLKMYVLSLISMDMINSREEIEKFFANTLYGEQFQDLDGLYFNIFRVIDALKKYGFVNQDDNYYTATKLGKKVSELYLNPDTAHLILENFDKISKKLGSKFTSRSDVYSVMHLLSTTAEMKPLFRILKKDEEVYMQKLEEVEQDLIIRYDPFENDLADFAATLKTCDVYKDWIEEAPEDYITEKYSITPGELHYKLEVIDWLLYCVEEFALQKKEFYIKNFINKLRTRFKFGVKEDVLVLISLKGVGRVRARKLVRAGFKTLSDLRAGSFEEISRVVGDSLTIKIKKEVVGEDYDYDSSKELKKVEKFSRNDKPKEIKVREVMDEEVDSLVEEYNNFEQEKKKVEEQKSLKSFF